MQRERRRDPYPWTWEIPVAVALAGGFVIVAALQLGRAAANLVAGAGWTWPDGTTSPNQGPLTSPIGTAFWTSLPGVVAGDASAGLPQHEASNGRLAGPALTRGCLIAAELIVVVALRWLTILVLQRWGTGRMRGMATAAEAERMLGVRRLRQVADIVRPDLYGKHAIHPATTSLGGPVRRSQPPSGDTSLCASTQPGPQLGRGLNPWLAAGRETHEPSQERR